MSIEVDIKRCLCVHSMQEAVDTVVQLLLYSREVIPQPVVRLMTDNNESGNRKVENFRDKYTEFGQVLRTIFKTARREMSKEVIVLIGNTPYSPKEVYRIPLTHCLRHGTVGGCGYHNCQLSQKERLEIFKNVGLMEFEDLTGKAKMFLFVRASRQLATLSEWLEEDESFELPSEQHQKRVKISSTVINFVNSTDESERRLVEVEDETWLRVAQSFDPFE